MIGFPCRGRLNAVAGRETGVTGLNPYKGMPGAGGGAIFAQVENPKRLTIRTGWRLLIRSVVHLGTSRAPKSLTLECSRGGNEGGNLAAAGVPDDCEKIWELGACCG